MSHLETNALRMLAKCWNNLDIRFIEAELAEDIIYESQWVLRPIQGKTAFLSYLQSKFKAIRKTMQSRPMSVTAEIGLLTSFPKRHCIVLTQNTSQENRQVSVLVTVREGKIVRIEVCFIPDPLGAKLTGELPI
jgi:hypothetical protein